MISFVDIKSTMADFTPSILFDSLSIFAAQLPQHNPSSKISFFNILSLIFSLTFTLLSILVTTLVTDFIKSSTLLTSFISNVKVFVIKFTLA